MERIVDGSRGGYCFEANTVLLELLRSLGFQVERREAVVGPRDLFSRGAPTDHLALVVRTADGAEMIAEGGFGEGPVSPLELREGPQTSGAFEVSFERDGDGWWFEQHEFSTTPGFHFGDAPVELDVFVPHHERLSTSPDSGFVRTLTVQKPYDDRLESLRARTLRIQGPGRDERAVLDDADSWAAVLDERFGIDLDVARQRAARPAVGEGRRPARRTSRRVMADLFTIGVYGFTVDSFLAELDRAGVNLILDVRQRRGVRGSEYAWANSKRLQDALAKAGLAYEHRAELAPTTAMRKALYAKDERAQDRPARPLRPLSRVHRELRRRRSSTTPTSKSWRRRSHSAGRRR